MSKIIDQYIQQNEFLKAIEQCIIENQYNLGFLIAKICQDDINDPKFYEIMHKLHNLLGKNTPKQIVKRNSREDIPKLLITPPSPIINLNQSAHRGVLCTKRVILYCNWCDSKQLCDTWNKMSKGNYTWNSVQIVWEEPYDFIVIINCAPITIFPNMSKTIYFQMEPHMAKNPQIWGDWANPPPHIFKFCGTHANTFNNNEWHISKTYDELLSEKIIKDEYLGKVLSTVLSDKYCDPGHIKRIDFVKFLENKGLNIHVYGGNKFEWKNYKGMLPYHCKDDALFPYKYSFNAENHEIRNYFTEKFIDCILSECLMFYWGCPNIRDYFDEKACVILSLEDFEKDYNIIIKAISENWWEQRLPYIKQAKEKILNEMQFFPRIERILSQ